MTVFQQPIKKEMSIGDRVTHENFLTAIQDIQLSAHASQYAEVLGSIQCDLLERSDEHDSLKYIADQVYTLKQLIVLVTTLQETFIPFLRINKIDVTGVECLEKKLNH